MVALSVQCSMFNGELSFKFPAWVVVVTARLVGGRFKLANAVLYFCHFSFLFNGFNFRSEELRVKSEE